MPMGRPRKRDKHLPRRVYFESGRYWFKPKKPADPPPDWKPRIDLGTTLAEMYDGLAKLSREPKPVRTMDELFDRFLLEAMPLLSDRTQADYRKYIERMRPVFQPFKPPEVTAGDLFDIRRTLAEDSGNVQANRHMSCLSAVFREAIGWKAVTTNPCRELKRLPEVERDRYVDDAEFLTLYELAPKEMHDVPGQMVQCMMDLAVITGQREGDLLRLPPRDPKIYTDDGIVFRPGKTRRRHPRHGKIIERAKTVIVEWSPDLKAVVERARKLGPDIRATLICNRDGEPYTESGFRSNWHRLMDKATTREDDDGNKIEPLLAEGFTFHDLRAKSTSDEEELMVAHDRAAHEDLRTTQKIYRRKPRRARAGRKVGA